MSDAQLLEGKHIADKLQNELTRELTALVKTAGRTPKIVAVALTNDQASVLYMKSQKRVAEKLGIVHETRQLPPDSTEHSVIAAIEALNNDRAVSGIIIQMPLPKGLSMGRVVAALDPLKDVEGIHANNLGLIVLRKEKLAPCTALAVMELIEHTAVDLYGAEVVIVGAGKVVGRPLALMLMEKMATVTVCNIATSERTLLESHVRRADIVIAAAGKAGLIPGAWIKKGSVVIDVGINHVDGKVVGDVDFEDARKQAAFITPVPGGVGPLTATILMRNVIMAFKLQMGIT